jgi:hypothetical protein
MSRLSFAVLALLLGPELALPGGAHAASRDDRKTLVVRGRVTDSEGWPVTGARVTSAGSHRSSVTVDKNGAFVLLVPVGSLEDVAARPFEVTVDVLRRGWRFSLPGGAPRLGIALSLSDAGSGVARGRVRSNEARAATAVAEALVLDGNASALVEMNFIGIESAVTDPAAPRLDAEQEVTLAGVRIGAPPGAPPAAREQRSALPLEPATGSSTTPQPAPAKPPAAEAASPRPSRASPPPPAPKPRVGIPAEPERRPPPAPPLAVTTRDDTTSDAPTVASRVPRGTPIVHPGQKPIDEATADLRPTTPPVLYPQPPRTRPAPDVPGTLECECRLYGTVEVFSERPLPEPTRFVVSLREHAALRDTVELFMGSPRSFDFRAVPCGATRLDVRSLSTRRFALTSREGQEPIPCERDGQHHLRLVLEPR